MRVEFLPDGVQRLAEIAFSVNEKTENIGARRLYTVMEKLLEEVSFHATRHAGQTVRVDAAFVDQRLGTLSRDEGEDLILKAYMSEDFREGMDAFLNKRTPNWKGR